MNKRKGYWVLAAVCTVSLAWLIAPLISSAESAKDKDDFDRLDGRGASGKKAQFIEWEGNAEIHVYPGGSLTGLGLKIDRKDKNKPVMVVSYRFDGSKTPIIRRNILTIDLKDGFKVYKDPSSGGEYDKIVITNHTLPSLVAFRMDAEPTQLYPDGHPALAEKKEEPKEARVPAESRVEDTPQEQLDRHEEGAIRPFKW